MINAALVYKYHGISQIDEEQPESSSHPLRIAQDDRSICMHLRYGQTTFRALPSISATDTSETSPNV